MNPASPPLVIEVLQHFRVIYGTMRRHFQEVEARCGLSGSQMWILQEVSRQPGMGVGELARRLGVHQSTCSQLVVKLVARGYLVKRRQDGDLRRVGLALGSLGEAAMAALPGPAEGVLPQALAAIPEVALKTLSINLSELVAHLPGRDEAYARVPLAEMVREGRLAKPGEGGVGEAGEAEKRR